MVIGPYECYKLRQLEVRCRTEIQVKFSIKHVSYHPYNKGIVGVKNAILDRYRSTKLPGQTRYSLFLTPE